MLLKNQWVSNEIKEEIGKYLKTNSNENNLTKSVGCSKSNSKREVHSNTGLPRETRKIQINNLTYHLKELEKEEQTKPEVSRRKKIINIREEINKMEIKKTIYGITKTESWFFEWINKMDKPLARLTKNKRERTQISKIRNERGEITTDTAKIQKNHANIL